jgi:DNA-binding NarL/FixJ family response regulator
LAVWSAATVALQLVRCSRGAGPAIRILIADDHPITRSGLSFLIGREPDLSIVGFAADGDSALVLVNELHPDILLLDLMLPKRNGLSVLEQLAGLEEAPAVLVMSGQGSGLDFQQALNLGAAGLVSKEDVAEAVIEGIRALQAGRSYCSQRVRDLVAPLGNGSEIGAERSENLTPREREVLRLIAEGQSNVQIGLTLDIATKTVKKHRENIRAKTGAGNAVELTRLAVRLGLIAL